MKMKLFKVYFETDNGYIDWLYVQETNKVNAKTKFWLEQGVYPIGVEEVTQ